MAASTAASSAASSAAKKAEKRESRWVGWMVDALDDYSAANSETKWAGLKVAQWAASSADYSAASTVFQWVGDLAEQSGA